MGILRAKTAAGRRTAFSGATMAAGSRGAHDGDDDLAAVGRAAVSL